MPQPAVTFAEILELVRQLPGPDLEAGTAVRLRERDLVKPAGSLGQLEEIAFWMASWQGRKEPRCERPRVAIFAGSHGVAAARRVSAYPPTVNQEMIGAFQGGGAAINQLCRIFDADLRVYELDLETPTGDITQGPALSEESCAQAIAYGMMAVEQGVDLLCLGEMGIGNTTAAAALCLGLFGGEAADWTGAGSGLDARGLAVKTEAVEEAVAANRAALTNPMETLRALGGLEFAAALGAIIAARLARTPVLLDGFASTAAAAVLWAIDRTALDHCMAAHRSAEPGHARLLDMMGKTPLLDLDMRLGEASGAALGLPIVKAAIACHTGMGTFEDAKVSRKLPA